MKLHHPLLLTALFPIAISSSIATAEDTSATITAAGMHHKVVFDQYPDFSRTSEFVRRVLSPLNAIPLIAKLAQSPQAVRDQAIDLAHEEFAVYVPVHEPPNGYALLVFVPPWEDASPPTRWVAGLESHSMIFVSAANSGNDANVLDRREPLALLAAHNVLQRFHVDREHVYLGGFSGGSRVAMRIALAYPDVFRGVLLSAGSDPIGDAQIPLPPAELFHQFQESVRLVYGTGRDDATNLEMDAHSRKSMHDWCVSDIDTVTVPFTAHAPADASAFNRLLDRLFAHAHRDKETLTACRERIDKELDAQLQDVASMLAVGKRSDARAKLQKIDARYGGLAAPHSVELLKQIGAKR